MKVRELIAALTEIGLEAEVAVTVPAENRSRHYPIERAKCLNLRQWCAEDIGADGDGVFAVLEIERGCPNDLAGTPREQIIEAVRLSA